MRPRRMSVASLAFAGESPASARVVFVFLMRELCGTEDESTNEGIYTDLHRGYAQAHVCGMGRVGEEADGNKIDASFGVGANIFETDAAGAFDGNARFVFRAALYGAAHVFGGHVVEENGFRAVGKSIFQLGHGAHFYFDGLRAATIAKGAFERGNDSAGERDVIVFEQDSVGEVEAVILPSAAADGVFVDHAQAGRGLASIENAGLGAGNCVDKFAGQSGDAAHPLQKIEHHSFARQDHASVVLDDGDGLAFVQTHAIENFVVGSDLVVRGDGSVERGVDVEDAADAADASENAILLGEERGGGALTGIDAGVTGGIAGGPVFEQRVLDNCRDASAVEVHKCSGQFSVFSG